MKNFWLAGSSIGLALMATLAAPAMAQTAASAGASTGADNDVMGGDIVVTARKREETIQSIPAAVSAVTQETLTRAGAQSLDDVARLTPGLTFNSGNAGGLAAPTMRGITNITSTTFDNNVGVFLDGVYMSSKSNLDIDLYNLARVEVIKGPQSALYGNNAFAGAINYVLDRPKDYLTGQIKASVGTDSLYEVAGKISVPITRSLSIMGVGTYSHFGGTIKNVQGSNLGGWDHKISASGMIDYHPESDFSASLFYYHYEDELDGGANYMFTNDCGGTISPTILPNRGGSTLRFKCGTLQAPDEVDVDSASYSKRKTNLVIGRMAYEFGPVTLRYTGSYAKYDTIALQDQHLNSYGGTLSSAQRRFTRPFVGPVREWSSEVRLESYDNAFLDWAAGGYYYDRAANQTVVVGNSPGQVSRSLDLNNDENATMKSVFGLVNFKFTPTFNIETQGRWTWEDKDAVLTNNLTGLVRTPKADFSYGTYRVTANWEWNPDRMLYAVVASGTKSGGFNNTSVLSEQSYGPEKNTSFEIGSKNTFLGGRVIMNVAAYYVDWNDLQISVPSSVTGQTNPVTNIGSATVKGFEFSTAVKPSPNWDVSFGYNYADSTWDDGTIDYSSSRICPTAADCGLTPAGSGIDVGGFQIPRTSKHQFSAATNYTIPLATSELYLHADMSYRSEQATNAIALQKVPQQTLVNARIGWIKDGYELSVFAKNLFDKNYIVSSINEPEFFPSTTFTTGFVGNGRVIGATVEAKF
ncbi:TonB-dependent receptor [Novosphingobium sp. PY1]|uniref:TonB-dependent receptor n=1 Tax=Novosphingobium sp. PY1 TaxID=1882221 RepID=UPI001A8FF2F9|nr:TonB-dependent receptor [Novosphingobium sp. PY1]GFM27480.1 TonB-dependent receptor [Novosphingobium sp. PY1]